LQVEGKLSQGEKYFLFGFQKYGTALNFVQETQFWAELFFFSVIIAVLLVGSPKGSRTVCDKESKNVVGR